MGQPWQITMAEMLTKHSLGSFPCMEDEVNMIIYQMAGWIQLILGAWVST